MPYPRHLQPYVSADCYAVPPDSWTRRLREISPVTAGLDHLVFRRFTAHPSWQCADRDQWMLYTAKPVAMVDPERASQFAKHWTELPLAEQAGRQVVVSDYQHFMWHSQGVYVKPFLILQGEWGGTPAKYTETEKAMLRASNVLDEPFPIGSFPACPFDERTVKQITMRDRLLAVSNNYEALEKSDRADSLRRVDDAAERLGRETYLKTWSDVMAPSVEFMRRFLHTSEADRTLPSAPAGLNDALAQWKDHFIEHGNIMGATVAGQRKLQIAVA